MIARRRVLAGLTAAGLAGRAARAETATVRVGDQKGGTHSVMKAAGVLDGLPYQLEWSQFAAAAPLLEALNAGAVDLAYAGDAPATFALAAGLRARIISPIRTSGAGTAVLVSDGSPLCSAADLKGRTVAVNRGSIGHALLLSVEQSQGWAPGMIRLANLLPGEAKTALTSGAVDAWCSWGVYVAQGRLVDGLRVVVDGGGLLTGLSYLLATEDAIERQRAALADFVHRLAVARRWAQAHPEEYATVLAAEIGVEPRVARLIFDTETPVPIPVNEAVIADEQKTADLDLSSSLIRSRLDARDVFDASFNGDLSG